MLLKVFTLDQPEVIEYTHWQVIQLPPQQAKICYVTEVYSVCFMPHLPLLQIHFMTWFLDISILNKCFYDTHKTFLKQKTQFVIIRWLWTIGEIQSRSRIWLKTLQSFIIESVTLFSGNNTTQIEKEGEQDRGKIKRDLNIRTDEIFFPAGHCPPKKLT